MKLCEFVREKSPVKYITQFQGTRGETSPLPKWLSKFSDYFSVPYFYRYNFTSVNMWLGYPSSGTTKAADTNAHFDGVDNLFAVLSGQKTFQLYDPTSGRGLYTYAPISLIAADGTIRMGLPPNPDLPFGYENPFTSKRPKTAQVPLHLKDAPNDPLVKKLFPLYGKNTTKAVCVVNAGDIIYFPGCYFHEVNSRGRHLGVNFWFRYDSDLGVSALTAREYSPASGLKVYGA